MILLQKILSVQKLNLTWSKQTIFNKFSPLPRVFQIVLRDREIGNLSGKIYLSGGGNLTRSNFGRLNLFQSQKQHFLNIEH